MLQDKLPFNMDSQSSKGWMDRAEKSADLISSITELSDKSLSIADVGCGDEKLRTVLKRLPVVFTYQGYDLHPQSSNIKRFDANHELLDCDYDFVFSLGLTEYVDLANFFVSTRKRCKFFVVSHVLRDLNNYSYLDLNRLGWINHLSSEEFERELVNAQFNVIKSIFTSNRKIKIWLCSNDDLLR